MTKRSVFLIVLLCLFKFATCQDPIEFEYEHDAAGNRTCRSILVLKSSGAEVQENDTTSIKDVYYTDLIGMLNLQIYPNPIQDKINIKIMNYNDYINGIYNIYSAAGKLLHKGTIQSATKEYDMSPFSKGIYYMEIIINGVEKTYKIIKQ